MDPWTGLVDRDRPVTDDEIGTERTKDEMKHADGDSGWQ